MVVYSGPKKYATLTIVHLNFCSVDGNFYTIHTNKTKSNENSTKGLFSFFPLGYDDSSESSIYSSRLMAIEQYLTNSVSFWPFNTFIRQEVQNL